MTDHHLVLSLGNPKAQPPTPRQTPTSAVFPSPVFETPKPYHGSFTDSGGLTPRFAEEYSVFNSTPGNLRGTNGPFADFVPATPVSSSGSHKRLLSAEGLAVEIATHVTHFSPNPNLPLPPVDPSRRLPSSPVPSAAQKASADADIQLSPNFPRSRSFKKARRGSAAEQPQPPQVISPPPTTTRKGERKLAPKLNMQNDPAFCQPDFAHDPLHQDMTALMGSSGDLFAYPMSASMAAPPNFWDSSVAMGMDLDFNAAGAHAFQPATTPAHHHTGSFDWNAEVQLFQEANVPLPCSNQENVQPARRERALAPKPPASEAAMTTTHPAALDDPFGITNPGDGVDPGLLFSRPQTAAMDAEFGTMAQAGPTEAAVAASDKDQPGGETGRAGSAVRGPKNAKLPDRKLAGSPMKASARPGLGRSFSENRGKRALVRGSLPSLASAARPGPPHNSGSGALAGKLGRRPPGRASPSQTLPRSSASLASIPESYGQHRPRTSVRFTIDAHGRARAETTVVSERPSSDRGFPGSRPSPSVSGSRHWESSDDESSSDDDPIIIPSRNTSFNASYALPDSRKPVASIFRSLRRSASVRSASNSANDAESEAETVINERQHNGGDATSELRRVVEDRQKRLSRMGSARSQRFVSKTVANFAGGIISPTSLTESSQGPVGLGVRCVCDKMSADEGDGFMLRCESCEMWLHGKCINVTRRSMPSVYICRFCASAPDAEAGRARELGLGIGMVSPLANKSFKSFR